MRGISLDEIASATKIGTRSLRALEEEHFKILPGGIFNKGFVRAYAKFLGIDEEQAVADYLTAAGEETNDEINPEQLAAARETQRRNEEQKKIKIQEEPSGMPWGALTLLVVVLAVVGFGWRFYNERKARMEKPVPQPEAQIPQTVAPVQLPPVSETPQAATVQVPDQPTGASANSQSAAFQAGTAVQGSEATADTFVVSLKATSPAWVSVSADGQNKLSKVMSVNEEQVIRARKEIKMTLGNAGGVELSWNGKPQGAVGIEGQTKHLTFTPEGMRQ
jgi:cytoskeletal protein RodZ